METPIYDFLRKYADSETVRCHMPGHKGHDLGLGSALDITEIAGADSLFEADGIIRRSERAMSELYGTADTFYSAGGSTLCIQAMLAAMKQEGRTVIAVRNVHRAFLNAAALLDLDVEWVMPDYTDGILSGTIPLADIGRRLAETPNACVYLTSPDYTGRMADIRGISAICRRYGAPLLVDSAHGAHLRFMPTDLHPITLGADICCDSAHKTLPALTGAALLHTSSERYAGVLRQCMSLFASTSPSYLIMASLDLCCGYIAERIRSDIELNIAELDRLRRTFADRTAFADGDPFHITLRAAESGYDGTELAELLRRGGVEFGAVGRREPRSDGIALPLPRRAMSIRDAVFSPSEEVPVTEAEGRICAAVKVPCPPAVPIAASGEVIDRECIAAFGHYGIKTVNVVI